VSAPNLIKHEQFPSRYLRNRRDLIVYLPPGYREQPDRPYPVLYLHDGQNLFDGSTSFIPGMDWHVGQTADYLIYEGRVEPLIIVGIYNAGRQRLVEYTPTRAPRLGGGRANRYAKFLLEELRPFVQSEYRVAEGADRTGIGGSSLGGLLTLALGLWFPEVFTRLMVMSPSVWWDDQVIVKMVEKLDHKLPLRIWLDTGTYEPGWQRARDLCAALVEKGWHLFDDLYYVEIDGGDHSEAAWSTRVDPALRFLFPPPAPS